MIAARLSHEDLVAALSNLRPPPLTAVESFGDACAAIAIALAFALAIAAALAPVMRPTATTRGATPPETESPARRRMRLVAELKAVAPDEAAHFREALYRPGMPFDEDEIMRRLGVHGIARR